MLNFTDECLNFNEEAIMFNKFIDQIFHAKNAICLFAKHYIYKKRCAKSRLCIQEFQQGVYNIISYEKSYAIKNNRLGAYLKKWQPQEN